MIQSDTRTRKIMIKKDKISQLEKLRIKLKLNQAIRMPVATIYTHCTGANSVTKSMTHDLRMKSDEVQNKTPFS
jgi:hypothetical protein